MRSLKAFGRKKKEKRNPETEKAVGGLNLI